MIQNYCDKNKKNILLLANFLKVISEENRLRIICFLEKNHEQCVCKIWEFLELPQNLVSHHLKILKDFGLLNSRKEGLNVYYSVNEKELGKHRVLFNEVLNKSEGQNE